MVRCFWVSEARYRQPHDGLMMELQMWTAHGKARGEFDTPFEVWVAYKKAAKWGILQFFPQDPTIGGYVVNVDGDKFKEHLDRGDR
jgi:hypothetical protein